MKKLICAVCLLALSASVGWTAEAEDADKEEKATETEKIIVSATRTPTTLDKIGGNSATVITSEDIEAKKQVFIQDVLRGVPGLDVMSNGGPGTVTTAFIRGADSKNTLVLIDGIMVNAPSSPNRVADLGNLNVDNIERVEVVCVCTFFICRSIARGCDCANVDLACGAHDLALVVLLCE